MHIIDLYGIIIISLFIILQIYFLIKERKTSKRATVDDGEKEESENLITDEEVYMHKTTNARRILRRWIPNLNECMRKDVPPWRYNVYQNVSYSEYEDFQSKSIVNTLVEHLLKSNRFVLLGDQTGGIIHFAPKPREGDVISFATDDVELYGVRIQPTAAQVILDKAKEIIQETSSRVDDL